MNAAELYKSGQLDQAIDVLGTGLRDNPADAHSRTFLFELLCFAGKPGAYRAVAFLRPHFQLDELGVSLRLVADLPPQKGK